MGVSSRSSVRVLFRGTAPESAAPTVIRIAVAMGTSRPPRAGPRAKEPTINVNIGDVPDELRRHNQLYLVKTLNAVQRCCPHERNRQSHPCSENPVPTLPWVPPTPGASRGDRSGPFPRVGNVRATGQKALLEGLQPLGQRGASAFSPRPPGSVLRRVRGPG